MQAGFSTHGDSAEVSLSPDSPIIFPDLVECSLMGPQNPFPAMASDPLLLSTVMTTPSERAPIAAFGLLETML